MNTDYLDTLPEIKNKYKVNLQPEEKVLFTAKLWRLSTESGSILGLDDSRITMTNRRIIADNGQGVWITDIAEDVIDIHRVESGKFLSKQVYILVNMNKELTYGIGIQKISGYQLHFHKKDMAVFEEIIRNMEKCRWMSGKFFD